MPQTNKRSAGIDDLLRDAAALPHEYDDYDAVAARQAIAAGRDTPPVAAGDRPGAADRGRYRSAHDQARHELDLACALVLGAAESATSLEKLVNDQQRIDPEGALVFACLLHIAGHEEAADFWWHFAEGGGSRTAAYCLYLSRRRHGEFVDAEIWRTRASEPSPAAADAPRTAPEYPEGRRLLPAHTRRSLLLQWHRGHTPQLPAPLKAAVNGLTVTSDDDYGDVPQPNPQLTSALSRHG